MTRLDIKGILADPTRRRELVSRAIWAMINAEIHEVSLEYCYELYDRVRAEKESSMNCEGCDKPLDPVSVSGGYTVCFSCTKARHKAVLRRKCCCGRQKRPTEVMRTGSRSWISCHRCLGQIKQLS